MNSDTKLFLILFFLAAILNFAYYTWIEEQQPAKEELASAGAAAPVVAAAPEAAPENISAAPAQHPPSLATPPVAPPSVSASPLPTPVQAAALSGSMDIDRKEKTTAAAIPPEPLPPFVAPPSPAPAAPSKGYIQKSEILQILEDSTPPVTRGKRLPGEPASDGFSRFEAEDIGLVEGAKSVTSELCRKEPEPCYKLAKDLNVLSGQEHQPQGRQEAARLLTVLCEQSAGAPCVDLAGLLQDTNPEKARGHYRNACQSEDTRACYRLATWLQKDGNLREAAKYFYDICRNDSAGRPSEKGLPSYSASSCGTLGKIAETQGKREIAGQYYRVACKRGAADYCNQAPNAIPAEPAENANRL